ncbi:hypothetical protein NBRC111894_1229 [Sporolactobacillus inulinus]|uniref:Uncharacterized protein n=1 Tax=Sporolactobacillus inulinus TaxID=2078 RepID=A0A4Y1Z9I5_9BACL|nr:hypothetical protein NBRC111894_1229 [Sporolactobacillus inulinus]
MLTFIKQLLFRSTKDKPLGVEEITASADFGSAPSHVK